MKATVAYELKIENFVIESFADSHFSSSTSKTCDDARQVNLPMRFTWMNLKDRRQTRKKFFRLKSLDFNELPSETEKYLGKTISLNTKPKSSCL